MPLEAKVKRRRRGDTIMSRIVPGLGYKVEASISVFVIVSGWDVRAEKLLEPAK